jgi:hypothetical protein
VVSLSVVALVVHGAIALMLVRGTAHPTAQPGQTVAGPTSTRTPPPPASTSAPTIRASLHLDRVCLVPDNPPTRAAIPAGDPFGTDVTTLGAKAELQRLYQVRDRDLLPIDGAGPVPSCDQQLWAIAVAGMPTSLRQLVKELLVFDADNSAAGSGGVISDVTAAGSDANRWRMSLARNGLSDRDIAMTIAHETGRLAALNGDQMATPQPSKCQTTDFGQGCLSDSSYLVEFIDRTWTKDEFDAWDKASSASGQAAQDKAFRQFYDQHQAAFVNSYAATSPLADFAESFGVWCAFDADNRAREQFIEGAPADGKTKLAWFDHGSDSYTRMVTAPCTQLREFTR